MWGHQRIEPRLWLVPIVLATTVVAFAAGSGSIAPVRHAARTGRWLFLLALLVVAVAVAFDRARRLVDLRDYTWLAVLPTTFVGLAVVSTAWSGFPVTTVGRVASLGILVVAGASIGYWAAGDRGAIERLLIGIVAGTGLVALIGILLLVVGADAAVQGETSETGWRFRGFGENPNTVSMLCAVVLPSAMFLAFETSARIVRWLAGSAVLALYFTVIFSESRGAMLATLVGMLIVTPFVVRGSVHKGSVLALVVVAFVGGNAIRATNPTLAPPSQRDALLPEIRPTTVDVGPGGPEHEEGGTGAEGNGSSRVVRFPRFRGEASVRPEDEVGHPLFDDDVSTAGSGRLAAWRGAIDLVSARPLLGYGFGTESRTFVDRWYYFQGGNPENAFLGLLLQLGIFGLSLFVAIGLVVLALAIRALRRASELRSSIAALLAMSAAGATLMMVQSYVYSVGSIATATVWVATFVLAATAMRVVRQPVGVPGRGPVGESKRHVDAAK